MILGLVMLYVGSSLLVEGAAATAIMFAVRPVIVGLTIVSLATSAPELLVSLVAAMKGSGGISLGNILGSNVINIALVLGISAAIHPVVIKKQIVKVELPYMIFISLIFWVLCLDAAIGRIDGLILIGLLTVFLIYSVLLAKDKENGDPSKSAAGLNFLKYGFFIIAGIIMLSYGATFVVKEAIAIARQIGLSETFIGVSLVAFGTSLPELAASAVAAVKGESDISVGNVVGSNLFNICLVMGVVGLFNPMTLEKDLHYFQFPFMIFMCVLLFFIAYVKHRISKPMGYGLISLFVIYIMVSYIK